MEWSVFSKFPEVGLIFLTVYIVLMINICKNLDPRNNAVVILVKVLLNATFSGIGLTVVFARTITLRECIRKSLLTFRQVCILYTFWTL